MWSENVQRVAERNSASESWIQLTLVLVRIVLNALFAGSEMALVVLREGQIERMKHKGAGGGSSPIWRDPNQYLATIQLGITLAGFLASATAAVSLARPLMDPPDSMGSPRTNGRVRGPRHLSLA